MSAPDTSIAVPPPLWRNRDYMLLWSGQMVSTLGTGMSQLAYPLLILFLTGNNALLAGLDEALFSLPYLLFSLPAGALVDRWNRKRVMILCDTVRGMSMASIPIAAALGRLTVAQLFITTTIEGTLYVFFNLSETACLPRVVPKEQLPSASAQNEGGSIATLLLAPPLGGFLYQSIGRTVPFLVDAISYAASVISLSFIKTEFQEQRTAGGRHLRAEIAEGLSWLWHQPLIRFMAFLTGGLNFTNAASGLLLIMLAKGQHADARTIGAIFSIASVGGILGSLLAPRIQRRYGFGQVIIATVWVGALLWPLLTVMPNPVLLGAVMAGLFVTGPIYNAVQFSYRLALIPDQLQGRVNSSFRLLAFGFQPLGATLSGLLITWIGPHAAVIVFWLAVVALAVLTALNRHVRTARPLAAASD